jgi:hypothetical protein
MKQSKKIVGWMISLPPKGLSIKEEGRSGYRGQVFTFDICVLYVKCEDLTPILGKQRGDCNNRLRDGKFKERAKCFYRSWI